MLKDSFLYVKIYLSAKYYFSNYQKYNSVLKLHIRDWIKNFIKDKFRKGYIKMNKKDEDIKKVF